MVKERYRAIRHAMPYRAIPRIMVVALARFIVKWLNAFVCKGGLPTHSPRSIMIGRDIYYNIHCKLAFGSYAQVHNDGDPHNVPESRTVGAICLGPSDNVQGGYYFMSLDTAQRLHRWRWTPLPAPIEVVKQVEKRAKRDGQTPIITFSDINGLPLDDDVEDDVESAGVVDVTDELDLVEPGDPIFQLDNVHDQAEVENDPEPLRRSARLRTPMV